MFLNWSCISTAGECDTRHSQHGVVLDLRLPKRRAILGNEDELGWWLINRGLTVHGGTGNMM